MYFYASKEEKEKKREKSEGFFRSCFRRSADVVRHVPRGGLVLGWEECDMSPLQVTHARTHASTHARTLSLTPPIRLLPEPDCCEGA
jgi:hypothetical protein